MITSSQAECNVEKDIVIRSARPAEMPAVAAAYEWLFVPPGQRPSQWDEADAVRVRHEVSDVDEPADRGEDAEGDGEELLHRTSPSLSPQRSSFLPSHGVISSCC